MVRAKKEKKKRRQKSKKKPKPQPKVRFIHQRTMSSGKNPPVAAYPFLSKGGGHNSSISRGIDKPSSVVHEHQLDTETAALCQLKAELAILPDHLKSELVHAQRVAPDLVDDEHLSKFLHAENFNCEVSYSY